MLQGHGLVVTGTALSGEVGVGDRVRCLPGDQLFRVRSLQVHNQPVHDGDVGPANRAEPERVGEAVPRAR